MTYIELYIQSRSSAFYMKSEIMCKTITYIYILSPIDLSLNFLWLWKNAMMVETLRIMKALNYFHDLYWETLNRQILITLNKPASIEEAIRACIGVDRGVTVLSRDIYTLSCWRGKGEEEPSILLENALP